MCSVKSVKMLYGSETRADKMEDVRRLEQTEMGMARWMCSISLSDGSAVGRIDLNTNHCNVHNVY